MWVKKAYDLCISLLLASLIGIQSGCIPTVPNIPAGGPVPVQVSAPNVEEKVHFTLVAADGKKHECDAPCSLEAASGTGQVSLSGGINVEKSVVIPEEGAELALTKRNSLLFWSGALFGTIAMIGCTVLTIDYLVNYDPESADVEEAETKLYISIGLLGAAGIGFVMVLLAGKNDVQVSPKKTADTAKEGSFNFAGIGAIPTPDGGGLLTAAFRF